MESRFRRFIRTRRERTKSQTPSLNAGEGSRRSSFAQWPLPPIKVQSGVATTNTGQQECLLEAIPYDTVAAGKAPIFSSEPVKGNGPVKLQASRRLSTGELVATPEDPQPTINDIREGDYIVGRKDKRDLRLRPKKSISALVTSAVTSNQSLTNSPNTSKSATEKSNTWSLALSDRTDSELDSSNDTLHSDRILTSRATSSPPSHCSQSNDSAAGSTFNERYSLASTNTSPSVPIADEQNATVAALLRAEQSRLIELYAHHKTPNGTPCTKTEANQLYIFPRPPSKGHSSAIEVPLIPLPPPPLSRNHFNPRRSSNLSGVSSLSYDDNSDASSNQRGSLTSSYAASSSCTIQTAATDHDSVITRDDIHKIVDQMRSTYLRALDHQEPLPPKPSHSSKKKRRIKAGTARMKPSTLPQDRQTWHYNQHTTATTHGSSKRASRMRVASHPATDFGRLSPVEASPEKRERRPTARLQRVDSGVLGSLVARVNMGLEEGCVLAPTQCNGEDPLSIDAGPDSGESLIEHADMEDLDLEMHTSEPICSPGNSTRSRGNFF